MVIWYIFHRLGIFCCHLVQFPDLVSCTKKTLATLCLTTHLNDRHFFRKVVFAWKPGLSDGLFSDQKPQFWLIFVVLGKKNLGIPMLYGMAILVPFKTIRCILPPFWYILWYLFPLWYVTTRKIWQPCSKPILLPDMRNEIHSSSTGVPALPVTW
jgi:hypothetical protein